MMATVTGVGRRVARWVACAVAVACCVAGVALPARADGPVPVPSTPPTAPPSTPLFPGRTIRMWADFQFGEDIVPGREGEITPAAYLQLVFSEWDNGWNLTEQECQELVSTFWSGTGPDYVVEATAESNWCEIDAYYLGEARHAFYSLDESGHMQVRPPMAYLNQIASSFDNVSFGRLDFYVTGMNNAHCNASPSKEDLNKLLSIAHRSTCVWDVDDGATMPTTDDPLMEGDAEDYFTGKLAGAVGPFAELNPPVNPFTITPAPTTDPATGPSATASGDRSETSESSSTGLLVGIGAAIAVLLLVGAGALVVALRRRK
ncbi:hypothetical protein [uncultured Actinomyces sp.]|uniref:hypothetical protein n=1 Tax=uncultured Actinomyces sp. TaxID=249061 RepID=UPI00262D62A9|nr:hypothetical protein [uncultured Actinomyces sp.]